MPLILDARTATPHFPGIGRYVTNLARALLPELSPDERLTVLYDAAVNPAGSMQPWPVSPQFRVIPLSPSPFGLAQQWVIPRLLKQLGADLYHSAYYLMPYRPGVPTVLTVYDVIPLRFPAQSTLQARLLFRWATRLALRAAQQVVAISETARRDFIRHFRVLPERITAIPLATDPAFCPQGPQVVSAVRARYGLPEQFVLYLGSNKPHKNLVRLIEAWKLATRSSQLATFSLIIAGAWDVRYPEPHRRVEVLGLQDTVRFLGPLPEADLPALYSAATVFAFPSLYEGFGLPVLEAMACGAPVVCSNTSSLPEVAGEAALIFDPYDTNAIAGVLVQLCADADLRADLCARGLARATFFSWQRTAEETLKVYRKVM
ncbi:MAG: glycosyltransferase family 4 protein, partial [Anaerolineae bacterium]|nr:glycosyltransferase family 4 protein [Anaerolineae bacterium]